jgi:predicted extracellular nuclease
MYMVPRSRLLAIVLASAVLLAAGPSAPVRPQAGIRVFEIQSAAHRSPLADQSVEGVPGVVTALRSNGFYLQDPEGDGRPETSDAVFVFTQDEPAVAVGDGVHVAGQVREFRPAGEETNLSITEIATPVVTVVAREQPLPPPIVLGPSGRTAPPRLLSDGVGDDVEAASELYPDLSAIDFFESLESMRVQVNDAVAVGRRAGPGELPVLPEHGVGVAGRTSRGGLLAVPPGETPPRLLLADGTVRIPPASLGDRFPGPTVGVVDYAFGGYRIRTSELPPLVLGEIQPERGAHPAGDRLAVATLNVENLSARERPARLARLAETIVARLGGPDLLVLQELQDDSGTADDGVVTAGRSAGVLLSAIRAAGGPIYEYRELPPEHNQDGGEPGANIRVGFIFRTDRGLAFVDRPGGDAMTPVSLVADELGPRLSISPGRLAPTDPAWLESRKPLVGELTIHGQRVFVVGCHFVSKRDDQPLFGRFQPPARPSEARRLEQARLVHAFARDLLAADPSAKLLVLGDLNDVPGSPSLEALKGGLLTNLVETLPEAEQYTYVFNGQSEAIDHILVSPGLLAVASEPDIVHGHAELIGAPSDHDPILVHFSLMPRYVGGRTR